MTVGILIGYTKARLAELALFAEAAATICSRYVVLVHSKQLPRRPHLAALDVGHVD